MSDVKGTGLRGRIPDPCLEVSVALSALFLHKWRQVVQPPLWVSIPFSHTQGLWTEAPLRWGNEETGSGQAMSYLFGQLDKRPSIALEDTLKKVYAIFCISRDLQGASDYCGELSYLHWDIEWSYLYSGKLREISWDPFCHCYVHQPLYSNTAWLSFIKRGRG